jgi:hypothetical protein
MAAGWALTQNTVFTPGGRGLKQAQQFWAFGFSLTEHRLCARCLLASRTWPPIPFFLQPSRGCASSWFTEGESVAHTVGRGKIWGLNLVWVTPKHQVPSLGPGWPWCTPIVHPGLLTVAVLLGGITALTWSHHCPARASVSPSVRWAWPLHSLSLPLGHTGTGKPLMVTGPSEPFSSSHMCSTLQ